MDETADPIGADLAGASDLATLQLAAEHTLMDLETLSRSFNDGGGEDLGRMFHTLDRCLGAATNLLESTAKPFVSKRAGRTPSVRVHLRDNLNAETYQEVVFRLLELSGRLRGLIAEADSEDTSILVVDDAMRDQVGHISSVLRRDVHRLLDVTGKIQAPSDRRQVLDMLWSVENDLVSMSASARSLAAATTAEAAAADAQQAAGMTATASQAHEFDLFSKAELRQAWAWRIVTIGLLIAGIAIAYVHVARPDGLTTTEVLQRLSVGLPILALTALAAREAALHARHGMWAGHMAVQLRTLPAYTRDMQGERAGLLRADFGRLIFSGPPQLESRGRHDTDGLALTPEVVALLRTLLVRQS